MIDATLVSALSRLNDRMICIFLNLQQSLQSPDRKTYIFGPYVITDLQMHIAPLC